jgi:hypothetical protein
VLERARQRGLLSGGLSNRVLLARGTPVMIVALFIATYKVHP